MRRRYRPARFTNIGDILQKELKKRGFPVQIDDKQLKDFWEAAVGPAIAAQTRLEGRRKDSLSVKVSSSVWRQQLHFLKDEIIEKINRMPGSEPITDIRFSVGQIRAAEPAKEGGTSTRAGRAAPLKERDKRMIEETTATLKDPELKEMLKRLMLKEISRRRLMEKQAEKGRRK